MSFEKVQVVLSALPAGCYTHNLTSFINGEVSKTRRGTVSFTIELSIAGMESPWNDVRAVLEPFDNKLVPVLLFVDPA